VVFNAYGSALSAKARLALRMPPLILQQPTNLLVRIKPDLGAPPSTNATFRVSALSAYPLRYQWRSNGVPILDATNTTLVISNVQMDYWAEYRVAISDDVDMVLSAPAWLYPAIRPSFLQNPLSQSVAAGSVVSLSTVVTGWPPPFIFEWRRSSTIEWTNLQDSLTSFYSFTAPNVATSLQYRVAIKNVALPGGQATPFATITVLADADGDGMPDNWERGYGFETNNPADDLLDADGDRMLNWQEYVAGTDPTNAASYLRIDAITFGVGATLWFGAISNRTYTLQYTDALGTALWSNLTDVVARATNRTEVITDPDFRTNRFYRVATPRQP
jgi:hypothetical protein